MWPHITIVLSHVQLQHITSIKTSVSNILKFHFKTTSDRSSVLGEYIYPSIHPVAMVATSPTMLWSIWQLRCQQSSGQHSVTCVTLKYYTWHWCWEARPTFTVLSLPLCLEYNNGSYFSPDNSDWWQSQTHLHFTSLHGDVHWTVAVVSQRVCDSSRSPMSAYSELRPVIPVQTL